jgi:hypothetical protein
VMPAGPEPMTRTSVSMLISFSGSSRFYHHAGTAQ